MPEIPEEANATAAAAGDPAAAAAETPPQEEAREPGYHQLFMRIGQWDVHNSTPNATSDSSNLRNNNKPAALADESNSTHLNATLVLSPPVIIGPLTETDSTIFDVDAELDADVMQTICVRREIDTDGAAVCNSQTCTKSNGEGGEVGQECFASAHDEVASVVVQNILGAYMFFWHFKFQHYNICLLALNKIIVFKFHS